MSEEVLDELDLDQYRTSNEGRRRLIPAVKNCRKLRNCGLSETDCETVALALLSDPSHLTELDLSGNQLQDSAMMLLCAGLENPNCKLESLRLRICSLSDFSCGLLGFALMSNPSHLKELDLRSADFQSSAMQHLCAFLENPHCRLKILRLVNCTLSKFSCAALVSALKSSPSHLTELDLSLNFIQDSGVELLCAFLETSCCLLQTLRLERCKLSVISCAALVSALKSNPSHLTELDLSGNKLQDSDVQHLPFSLSSRLRNCGLSETDCETVALALLSDPSHLTELDLSGNELQDSAMMLLCAGLENPNCRLEKLHFCSEFRLRICSLSDFSCGVLGFALMSNPSHLKELDLRSADFQSSAMQHLCAFLENPHCILKTLRSAPSLSCVEMNNKVMLKVSRRHESDITQLHGNPVSS
uniref:NACHT LRR and PYD domain-containing protein n=1 Tax=Oryzias latipes TaxID=8090 RepID=H2LD89_ORYLA